MLDSSLNSLRTLGWRTTKRVLRGAPARHSCHVSPPIVYVAGIWPRTSLVAVDIWGCVRSLLSAKKNFGVRSHFGSRSTVGTRASTWPIFPSPTGNWLIASHLRHRFQPHPRPSSICPALTAGVRAGHWLGRGRRPTVSETPGRVLFSSFLNDNVECSSPQRELHKISEDKLKLDDLQDQLRSLHDEVDRMPRQRIMQIYVQDSKGRDPESGRCIKVRRAVVEQHHFK